ncbi:hypothetical protein D9M68_960280 [compost metagenome]
MEFGKLFNSKNNTAQWCIKGRCETRGSTGDKDITLRYRGPPLGQPFMYLVKNRTRNLYRRAFATGYSAADNLNRTGQDLDNDDAQAQKTLNEFSFLWFA